LPDFVVLGKGDEELRAAALAAGLALRVDELRRIAAHLGRNPSVVEAYAFDAQWSEHCSYKSSRHHLKTLPTSGPNVILGPSEDAGILHLGEHESERYGIVLAHESHNHPSQVVPFEGAATGVGGIVRDVLCMGARVVAIADALRFGLVEDSDSHQRYVATRVVDGIAAYGNAIGVPNIAGDVYFDGGFNDNCLVNVIALGIVKEDEIIHSKAPPNSTGWDIVLVGKATDASGFGGAAFSSLALDEADTEANKGAVQVPDPFLKSVIMRASYRVFDYLREHKITAGFKDLGAGGIMGCTAELCGAGGLGAIIDLDDVSTAQENLPPAVIAIGETQERLAWVLPPDATLDVLRIYNEEFSLPQIARGARAAVIGVVQKEKRYVLRTGSDIVMDVDIEFLTGQIKDDLPYDLVTLSAVEAQRLRLPFDKLRVTRDEPSVTSAQNTSTCDDPLSVLSNLNVCSREPLYQQYDSVVRGATVLARNADAGVMTVPGTALGFALAVAGNPQAGKFDARRAAERAVVEAVCKVAAVGAKPLGLTDCLNFGNPRKRDQYSQFVGAIEGLRRAALRFGLPFVSGNVSLYNESAAGQAIPASAIVACVGAFADVSKVITPAFKRVDSKLYLGDGDDPAVLNALLEAMRGGAVRACSVASEGGTIAALAKMSWSADRSGRTIAAHMTHRATSIAFIVEADEGFAQTGAPHFRLVGETTADPTMIVDGRDYALAQVIETWSKPLAAVYG